MTMWTRSAWWLLLGIVFVSGALAQTITERLTGQVPEALRLALSLSVEDEIRAGRQATANLLGVAPLVDDDGLQQYVNTVGRWVAMGSERPDLPWRFGVIESADVNAFAAPGGYVLITRGLYGSLSDESELAGVLGHEIAHVVEGHHVELMRSSLVLEMGVRVLEREVLRDREALVRRLVGTGAELFARRLDQEAEFEADRNGTVLAVRAGYGPYGLPAVLQKIASVEKTDDRLALLYQTHPAPEDRLRHLDSALGAELQRYEPGGRGGRLYPLR
jgi:beta-barrel assembly-enhancing protease